MKLLASLVAAATADYACCPYDEFGVVFSGCPLTEKTPWAIDSNNADPHGVEHHMCKAWEVRDHSIFSLKNIFVGMDIICYNLRLKTNFLRNIVKHALG